MNMKLIAANTSVTGNFTRSDIPMQLDLVNVTNVPDLWLMAPPNNLVLWLMEQYYPYMIVEDFDPTTVLNGEAVSFFDLDDDETLMREISRYVGYMTRFSPSDRNRYMKYSHTSYDPYAPVNLTDTMHAILSLEGEHITINSKGYREEGMHVINSGDGQFEHLHLVRKANGEVVAFARDSRDGSWQNVPLISPLMNHDIGSKLFEYLEKREPAERNPVKGLSEYKVSLIKDFVDSRHKSDKDVKLPETVDKNATLVDMREDADSRITVKHDINYGYILTAETYEGEVTMALPSRICSIIDQDDQSLEASDSARYGRPLGGDDRYVRHERSRDRRERERERGSRSRSDER